MPTLAAPLVLGFSSKMYFGHAQSIAWARRLVELSRRHAALVAGAELFVLPTAPSIEAVARELRGSGIAWGAQHCHPADAGAHTGDVSAAVLAELGCSFVEVGHAERRHDHGEGEELIAATAAAVLRHGMTPVLCIGEIERGAAHAAVSEVIAQVDRALRDAPAGRIVAAYEPVWAIGAAQPAPDDHITAVGAALRVHLGGLLERAGSAVIYGGSAQPGQLARLGGGVDGLFLGRFAHDPAAVVSVLDEAKVLP